MADAKGRPLEERLTAVEVIATRATADIADLRQQQRSDMTAIRNDMQLIHNRISAGNERQEASVKALEGKVHQVELLVAGEAARTIRMLWYVGGTVIGAIATLVVLLRVFGAA